MKKRKIPKAYKRIAAGVAIGAAAFLTACHQNVYGPPPMEDEVSSDAAFAAEERIPLRTATPEVFMEDDSLAMTETENETE